MNRNIPKFYVCDEMQKLRDGLNARKIRWQDKTSEGWPFDMRWICRTHFKIRGDLWSVIHGLGTYGGFSHFENDAELLECRCGELTEPVGWLTADDVLKMVDEKKGGGTDEQ